MHGTLSWLQGEIFFYTVEVKNIGPEVATNVFINEFLQTVTDEGNVPAHGKFTPPIVARSSVNGGFAPTCNLFTTDAFFCRILSMEVDEVITLEIPVEINEDALSGAIFENIVKVTSNNRPSDPDVDFFTKGVQGPIVDGGLSDFTIEKTFAEFPASENGRYLQEEIFFYTIEIK